MSESNVAAKRGAKRTRAGAAKAGKLPRTSPIKVVEESSEAAEPTAARKSTRRTAPVDTTAAAAVEKIYMLSLNGAS